MDTTLKFEVKRIYRLDGDGRTRAFVDLVVNDGLLLKGIRIVNGQKGLFVSMPQEQGKDSKWYNTIRPLNKEIQQGISSVVLSAYNAEE